MCAVASAARRDAAPKGGHSWNFRLKNKTFGRVLSQRMFTALHLPFTEPFNMEALGAAFGGTRWPVLKCVSDGVLWTDNTTARKEGFALLGKLDRVSSLGCGCLQRYLMPLVRLKTVHFAHCYTCAF